MNDEEMVVCFCHPKTAKLLGDDDAVITTPLVPDGKAVVVPEDEFIEWLKEHETWSRREDKS